MTKKLTATAFQNTKNYIFSNGRSLDQHLFAFHFEAGNAASVLAALAEFQNEDGGFGHGLEPDIRTPASSAIATSLALGILRKVDASAETEMVRRAVEYLLGNFNAEKKVWVIVPPAVEDAPHAPWWTYETLGFGGFIINPFAALVGHLNHYAKLVPSDFLAEITAVALSRLKENATNLGMFDFFCYQIMAKSTNIAAAQRSEIQSTLIDAAAKLVETDPQKWTDYVAMPLDVVSAPDSSLVTAVAPQAVQANLDYLVQTQLPDGSWPIPWSWEFIDAAAWAQAEKDWKSHIAVRNLMILRAFDRIE